MILNRQKQIALNVSGLRAFARRLGKVLRLGRRNFNVCFVDDREIARLNATYRGRPRPTDVLSFAWEEGGAGEGEGRGEFKGFLGDVVISTQTAWRNARREGHSTAQEARWLILHGLLHLLGHDHETDHGEMTALELSLREKLGIAGRGASRRKTKTRMAR